MKNRIVTEPNAMFRMLGREALKPFLFVAIAGVCLYSFILGVPGMIWNDAPYTAEEIQQITINLRYGIFPTPSRSFYLQSVYGLLVTGPLLYGLAAFLLKIFRRQPTTAMDVFFGFSNFKNAFLFYVVRALLVAIGGIFLLVPGIILALGYSMGFYFMCDNPDLSARSALRVSRQAMKGNKWKLFTLYLSFIGWAILGGLVTMLFENISPFLGAIAEVFLSAALTGYVMLSEIAFYEMLTGHLHRVEKEEPFQNDNNFA